MARKPAECRANRPQRGAVASHVRPESVGNQEPERKRAKVGGFREGSGRKLRTEGQDSLGFTEAEEEWISAVVADSPLRSEQVKRGAAELMVTAIRVGRYTAKLESINQLAQDDAKAFAAAFGRYLKALDLLKLADPPPPEDPFADKPDPPATTSPQPASKAKRDALLEEIAE